MRTIQMTVKKQGSETEYNFNAPLPESLAEAVEVYGEESVLYLVTSALTVKMQGIARAGFTAETPQTREEVEKSVAEYRPGTGTRTSLKATATDMLIEKGAMIQADPDLKAKCMKLFSAGEYGDMIALLRGEQAE